MVAGSVWGGLRVFVARKMRLREWEKILCVGARYDEWGCPTFFLHLLHHKCFESPLYKGF